MQLCIIYDMSKLLRPIKMSILTIAHSLIQLARSQEIKILHSSSAFRLHPRLTYCTLCVEMMLSYNSIHLRKKAGMHRSHGGIHHLVNVLVELVHLGKCLILWVCAQVWDIVNNVFLFYSKTNLTISLPKSMSGLNFNALIQSRCVRVK